MGRRCAPKPSSSATRPTTAGQDTADFDELIRELDEEITKSGVRGNVAPDQPARRHRSTRRRQDAPDLPTPQGQPAHLGQDLHRAGRQDLPPVPVRHPDLPVLRPGRPPTACPVDPARYDYDQAARDALTFAALFDRFIQNLRRYLGYDVQYFAAIEPQRRLAPHVHIAIRGTIARVRAAPGARRDLPPGLVARRTRSSTATATSCPSGTRPGRRLRRPGHRGGAADLG